MIDIIKNSNSVHINKGTEHHHGYHEYKCPGWFRIEKIRRIPLRLTPNADTKAALEEYSEMKKNPGSYKRYDSFESLMDEVLSEV